MTATPAAPAPPTTTRRLSSGLSTTRAAFISAASTTTAVPCWSSWNTGIGSRSLSRRSTSKQRGAEMSSRLMPPNDGARRATVSTSSSTSVVSRQTGTASMSGEVLEQHRLALHDRQRGRGSDVAQAQHRRPVGDDGDRVGAGGVDVGELGVERDGPRDLGDAGRVRQRELGAAREGAAGPHLELAAAVVLEHRGRRIVARRGRAVTGRGDGQFGGHGSVSPHLGCFGDLETRSRVRPAMLPKCTSWGGRVWPQGLRTGVSRKT